MDSGRWLPLFIFLCLSGVKGNGQGSTDLSENSVEWNPGGVEMIDGKVLEGLVKYEPRTGLLSLSSGDAPTYFSPSQVLEFWYQDPSFDARRTYYSLIDSSEDKDGLNYSYFEVLKEFQTFAILSRKEPLSTKIKYADDNSTPSHTFSSHPDDGATQAGTVSALTEILYVLDENGGLKPFLRLTNKYADGTLLFVNYERQGHENKSLNDDIIATCTAPYYEQIREYATKNKLSFKDKDDLMKILDYYGVLSGQSSVH